jgi:hypothetical protein
MLFVYMLQKRFKSSNKLQHKLPQILQASICMEHHSSIMAHIS